MDIFKTKNLFIATYLLASNRVKFLGVEKFDNKTKLFLFSPPEIARQAEAEYFSGGSLPVKRVFSEYNTLKDLLFSQKTNGDTYEWTSNNNTI